jgi:hypothetical protein
MAKLMRGMMQSSIVDTDGMQRKAEAGGYLKSMDMHRMEQRNREMKGVALKVRQRVRISGNRWQGKVILSPPDGVDLLRKPAQ